MPERLTYRSFARGVVDVVDADQIQDDAVARAVNIVLDQTGNLRTRPGLNRIDYHRNLMQNVHDQVNSWSTLSTGATVTANVGDGPLATSGDADTLDNTAAVANWHDVYALNSVTIPTTVGGERYTVSIYIRFDTETSGAINSTPMGCPSIEFNYRDSGLINPDRRCGIAINPLNPSGFLGTQARWLPMAPMSFGAPTLYSLPTDWSVEELNVFPSGTGGDLSKWHRVQITFDAIAGYDRIHLLVYACRALWKVEGTNLGGFAEQTVVNSVQAVKPTLTGGWVSADYVHGTGTLAQPVIPMLWGGSVRRGGIDPHPLRVHNTSADLAENYPTSRITSIHQYEDASDAKALFITSGTQIWKFNETIEAFEDFDSFTIEDTLSAWVDYDDLAILCNPGHGRLVRINDATSGAPADISTTTIYGTFDGTNSRAAGGAIYNIPNGTAELTLRARVRIDEEPGTLRCIVARKADLAAGSAGYALVRNAAGNFEAYLSDGANQASVSGVFPSEDGEDEVWLRVDRTNQLLALAVNGAVFLADITTVGSPSNAQNFWVGQLSGGTARFLGDLREVAIWTSALTDKQIGDRLGEVLIGGDASSYWKFDEGTGTTATDTEAVANLTLTSVTWTSETTGSPDPTSPSIAVWNDRVWVVVDNQVHCSALGDPLNWTSTGPASGAGTFEIGGEENSPVTAIYPHQGKLWVFKRDRIYYIEPGNPVTSLSQMAVRSWSSGVGCVAPQSLQTILNDTIFLSNYGIVSLSASQGDVDVSELDTLTQGLVDFRDVRVAGQTAVSMVLPDESWYLISFARGGVAANNKTWILDFSNPQSLAWTEANGKLVASSFGRRLADTGRFEPLVGGFPQLEDGNNTYVYWWAHHDPTFYDDGDPYQSLIEFKCYDGGDPFGRKVWHRWILRLQMLTDDLDLITKYYFDLDTVLNRTSTWNFTGAVKTGALYGSGEYDDTQDNGQVYAISATNNRRIVQRFQGSPGRTARHVGLQLFTSSPGHGFVVKELQLRATPISHLRD